MKQITVPGMSFHRGAAGGIEPTLFEQSNMAGTETISWHALQLSERLGGLLGSSSRAPLVGELASGFGDGDCCVVERRLVDSVSRQQHRGVPTALLSPAPALPRSMVPSPGQNSRTREEGIYL